MKVFAFRLTFGFIACVAFFCGSISAQTVIMQDEDMRIEVEPGAKTILFSLYDEEITSSGHSYTVSFRLSTDTVMQMTSSLSDVDLDAINELDDDQLEMIFGPLRSHLEAPLPSAEKSCERYRCKQIIFDLSIREVKNRSFNIRNVLRPGSPSVRTTTIKLIVPASSFPLLKNKRTPDKFVGGSFFYSLISRLILLLKRGNPDCHAG